MFHQKNLACKWLIYWNYCVHLSVHLSVDSMSSWLTSFFFWILVTDITDTLQIIEARNTILILIPKSQSQGSWSHQSFSEWYLMCLQIPGIMMNVTWRQKPLVLKEFILWLLSGNSQDYISDQYLQSYKDDIILVCGISNYSHLNWLFNM